MAPPKPPPQEPRAEPREEDREPRNEDRAPGKERQPKDDGRYIIFYDFGGAEEGG